jgi:hypothetical protein
LVRVMGVGVLVALALALAALALIATPERATPESARADDYDECYLLNMEGVSDETQQATRDGLDSRGWYDDPTDSVDALYSPDCGALGEFGGEA